MKKQLSVILGAVAMVATVAACGPTNSTSDYPFEDIKENGITSKVAMVTDVGKIDDHSFNQYSYEGIKKYCDHYGIDYSYYQPTDNSEAARMEKIDAAVAEGAGVVVTPGFLFETTIYEAQTKYPDVQFILLDGNPHTADYGTYKTEKNTYAITYKEQEAGYLAGYAIVKDGYTKAGFFGGMSVPAVVKYGYGYLNGMNDAAKELGLADGAIEVKYGYSGEFAASDSSKAKMSGWYSAGTEIVFACGGSLWQSVVGAAETIPGKKVVGVDVDQALDSDIIVTSACKGLTRSVMDGLNDLNKNGGKFSSKFAGQNVVLGAAESCIELPTAEGSWRFNKFTVAEYEAVLAKIAKGEISIYSKDTVEEFPTEFAKLKISQE